jgi:hypothetical protein
MVERCITLIMVYGVIQLETCLANDTSRPPDLGPKDELVGYGTETCDGLRSDALFATEIYQSAGLIQIDSVRDEIIIGGDELCRSSFYLIEGNDVRTLWIESLSHARANVRKRLTKAASVVTSPAFPLEFRAM